MASGSALTRSATREWSSMKLRILHRAGGDHPVDAIGLPQLVRCGRFETTVGALRAACEVQAPRTLGAPGPARSSPPTAPRVPRRPRCHWIVAGPSSTPRSTSSLRNATIASSTSTPIRCGLCLRCPRPLLEPIEPLSTEAAPPHVERLSRDPAARGRTPPRSDPPTPSRSATEHPSLPPLWPWPPMTTTRSGVRDVARHQLSGMSHDRTGCQGDRFLRRIGQA